MHLISGFCELGDFGQNRPTSKMDVNSEFRGIFFKRFHWPDSLEDSCVKGVHRVVRGAVRVLVNQFLSARAPRNLGTALWGL